SLTKDDLYRIIDIEIEEVKKRLKEQNLEIVMAPEDKELLVEKGFDPIFGARPLKRTIQRLLEDPLAEDIISGKFKPGVVIRAVRKGDIFGFEQ
ncbi:MAG: ATP-dependent Clp protease ATP-binding subunit ClpC, partial [Candidatus Omnitrophota bacterium]|nr:ATP-dependent Clp protease ATP-binding subunit ClpC [Candidatus Omnitrophota bacterium]